MSLRHFLSFAILALVALLIVTGCESNRAMTQHAGGAPSPAPSERARTSLPARSIASGIAAGGDAGAPRIEMPAGSIPTLDEEVWVIVRADAPASPGASAADDVPGTGALMCRAPEGPDAEPIPLPLVHTGVAASIAGFVASVDVTQQFENHTDRIIEALYVFPLPHNAAVNGFVMTVGDRRIRGIVRERQEAEAIYAEAKQQGYVASLLTQERPNVFTQAVANIEPGKRIDVQVTYYHTLPYHDGWYEFVFPMVVGPRFNPPGSTSGIGTAPRGGRSNQPATVTYLRPGERSGHDVDLEVVVDAGVELEEIESPSHAIDTAARTSSQTQVTLAVNDRIPNRDFVLRYRVADDTVKAGLMTHRGETGDYFAMMLVPPERLTAPRQPLELIFVIDCSGSMKGDPLRQAKNAARHALRELGPDDAFQIIRFSQDASPLGPRVLPATRESVRAGERFLEDLEAGGGTMMLKGIQAALDLPSNGDWTRYIVFMTDGFIGNEVEILQLIDDRIGDARIFSFGIGSAPNRYLIEQMARHGSGAVAYVGPGDSANDVMAKFVDRVQHPALTQIELGIEGGRVEDVRPRRIPDLYAGRPVIVTGRLTGASAPSVTVRGRVDGRVVETTVQSSGAEHPALPILWARMEISDLIHHHLQPRQASEVAAEVRQLAIAYGMMSPYTAFVAVDSMSRTSGEAVTVPVAVEVPEGVSYDTTVGQ